MAINKQEHAQWSSSFGFVLAAVGSAVGLGNIWKFPYMVGESGGSAFVIAYLFCIALVGFPILVAEWLIGRRGQKNPVNTFADVAASEGKSRSWTIVGATGILGGFLILSFYSVIGGWALNYITKVASGSFTGQDSDSVAATFDAMLASAGTLTIWHTVFMILTAVIVGIGVTSGIEKAAKILMPLLGVILFVIVGYNIMNGGFGEAVAYLFTPDMSKLTADVMLAALGHAFFTLSIGMGIMVAYGSYLGREVNLLKTARTVVILDTVIALAAGLAIFPIIFSNGLDPASGPGLIFVSLPIAFGSMSAGIIIGALFFLLITFAAVTSSISLLEPTVELLEERTSMSRTVSTIVASTVIWLLGIAALLSFNLWSEFTIMGNGIFDALDKITSKFLLPLTGLAAIVFVGWKMDQRSIQQELGLSNATWQLWQIVAKFIAPIAVIVVFVTSLMG
ncbi:MULTISPECIES: sodium-dependent transporter [Psychrobacter]|jgi:NSS family neurotransmitter:Na+ symporter|uniref:Neurotransmitter:Na+ symporter, NSS family n=4 Tax=Psychrobacter TaxID=497 RepID=A0A1G6VVJ2_9GAMM|nr:MULTISPECIES: sodium-dependent transporter [Psychrobacter]MED6318336.1 sodium-dependent transporter [Pseudomonadota bacterium]HBD04661.1 sodium-dependent transporter [Psychrobacter sp.]AOY45086.1 sodium:neurotransmitter symporter family protein [Psychrobacter sp. AntiMn-1]MDH4904383.1 sodium-dependent transporter [Psychrobacter pocilloporae]SDD57007.1 neurotransmitter:Na+ symporter, NSS family [Psychrobacter pacificensis]|tara:strand:- start:256 stop:1608 length:1353 start_codon:yes stop_codon:yes gene_type:complete